MRPATRMDQPALPPGICYRCRVSEHAGREYFVDTGISIDWEGVIYLCNMCLKDLARSTGEFFTKDEVDELLGIQTDIVERAQQSLNYMEKFSDWLKAFGFDLSGAREIFDKIIEEENERARIPAEYVSEPDESVADASGADERSDSHDEDGQESEGFVLKL